MSNHIKTLAAAHPGGRVRLRDALLPARSVAAKQRWKPPQSRMRAAIAFGATTVISI